MRPLALLALLLSLATAATAAESFDNTQPTVLITGANRGIGLELTRQYKERGDDVIAIVQRGIVDRFIDQRVRSEVHHRVDLVPLAF